MDTQFNLMLELQMALVTNLTGMYLLGVLTWYSKQTFSFRNKGNTCIYVLFGASFLELATHLITAAVQYYNFFNYQILGTFMYSFVFTINAVYIFAWVLYLNVRLGKESVHDAAYVRRFAVLTGPVVLLFVLSIVNIFIPIYFSYDHMVYRRLPGYYITLIIPIGYLIYGIILFMRTKQRKKLYQELPFVNFLLPVVVAHVLESLFLRLCVIPLANTISLVVLVLMNAKQNATVNPLSGVYTKSEMYRHLNEGRINNAPGKGMTGLMICMEYMRSIHTQFGQKACDQAISDLGFLIRNNIPNAAVAFQYSDDKFVILLEQAADDEVRSVISKLKAVLLHFNQNTATTYELHISYGIATWEENDTTDRFIERMEKRLYSNQQGKLHHS